MLMFWITDNFLMHHRPSAGAARTSPPRSRYCPYPERADDDEQVLLIDDERDSVQQRHPSAGSTVT